MTENSVRFRKIKNICRNILKWHMDCIKEDISVELDEVRISSTEICKRKNGVQQDFWAFEQKTKSPVSSNHEGTTLASNRTDVTEQLFQLLHSRRNIRRSKDQQHQRHRRRKPRTRARQRWRLMDKKQVGQAEPVDRGSRIRISSGGGRI